MSNEQTHPRTYYCGFCMTPFDGVFGTFPDVCPACHVKQCRLCGAFLKGDDPKFCHGCGSFDTSRFEARMLPEGSTAAAMHARWWPRMLIAGMHESAKTIGTPPLSIWRHKGGKMWIHDADDSPVRELTKDEIRALKEKD